MPWLILILFLSYCIYAIINEIKRYGIINFILICILGIFCLSGYYYLLVWGHNALYGGGMVIIPGS